MAIRQYNNPFPSGTIEYIRYRKFFYNSDELKEKLKETKHMQYLLMKLETTLEKKKFEYQEKTNAYLEEYYLKHPDKREKYRELNLLDTQKLRQETREVIRHIPVYMKNKIIKEVPVVEEFL